MPGFILTVGTAIALAAGVFAIFRWFRGRRARISLGNRVAAEAADTASPFGLTPSDAARLQQSARLEMRRDQALWGRDYLTGVSESAGPGRVAGIPRTLRVRRRAAGTPG